MNEEKKGTEIDASAIPPKETGDASTVQDDAEARIAALEAEKATILEREANYKMAYLKEKNKKEVVDLEETDEERIRRITREELNATRINQIESEKDALLKKTLKENKELKLAHLNKKSGSPASAGSDTEVQPVVSTLVTPEQVAAFKAKGWTEKDIERYKKNLQKYGGR